MLDDANTLATAQIITTDVCIIGAGPAGITLALELDKTPFRVMLLESGGFERSRELDKLNDGEVVGEPYQSPRHTRRRQVGGAANRWGAHETTPQRIGVRHMPLKRIEFEQRDWIPYSGWPFDREHLNPFYERAQKVCELGPFDYDPTHWTTPDAPLLPLKGDTLIHGVYQFAGWKSFTERHHQLTASRNVTLMINATVLTIACDEGGTNVTGVVLRSGTGHDVRISAKIVVMAVGGIEVPRLLLLSNAKHANGIGNQHDVVGRYFMDHPFAVGGLLTPTDRGLLDRVNFYDNRVVNGTMVMGRMVLSETTMRCEKLRNISFLFFPRRAAYMTPAWESFYTLWEQIATRSKPSHLGKHAKNLLSGLPSLAQIAMYRLQGKHHYFTHERGGWSALPNKTEQFTLLEVRNNLEQTPHPDNRITLSDQVDANGQRRVKIAWRFMEDDVASVRRARQLANEEFVRSGIGTLVYSDEIYRVSSNHHHLGSTRMGTDPKLSVVDPDCKVHEISNLYVASSSVFPTGSYGNPTLTIVALAIRLADHLKHKLRDALG
jgi:choline dehydrogenase-like flavoprotein